MTIVIGPITNVPAPGDPIRSNWCQTITHYVVDTPGMIAKTGGTMTGALTFNMGTAQQLNLLSTAYAIGVQSSTAYFRSNSNFAWYQGGTHNDTAFNPGSGGVEMMRLYASGLEVGRGLGYARPLAIFGTASDCYMGFFDSGATRNGYIGTVGSASQLYLRNEAAAGTLWLQAPGNVVFSTGAGTYTERGRFESSGVFLVGKTSSNLATIGAEFQPNGRVYVTADTSVTGNNIVANITNAVANDVFASFRRNNTQIGSVTAATTTSVAFNTTSDPRLKQNLGPLTDAATKVQQLGSKAFAGRWLDADTGQPDPAGELWAFLSSHDVEDVAPYAVTGERDAVTGPPPMVEVDGEQVPDPSAPPAGQIIPQQVDYSALVPLLCAALSQALDRIAALEAA